MQEEMKYLKDSLHRAQTEVDRAFSRLERVKKIKKRNLKRKRMGKINKCHDSKKRMGQLRDYQDSIEIQRINKQIQNEIDKAKQDFAQAKATYSETRQEFDWFTLWVANLNETFFDNFAVRAELNNPRVSIYFGGDGGDPFGENHGHVIIDVETWRYTYYREVGEPHSPKNHIRPKSHNKQSNLMFAK